MALSGLFADSQNLAEAERNERRQRRIRKTKPMKPDTTESQTGSACLTQPVRLWKRLMRMLPKFTYVNWKKAAPQAAAVCWKQWFSVKRYWSGKLIYIQIRHHSFQFDFRRDWLADMIKPNAQSSAAASE